MLHYGYYSLVTFSLLNLPREYILAIKFLVGNEKNMGHLLTPKSQNVRENVEKIGQGSSKTEFVALCMVLKCVDKWSNLILQMMLFSVYSHFQAVCFSLL